MFLVTSFIGRTKTCQAQYWSCHTNSREKSTANVSCHILHRAHKNVPSSILVLPHQLTRKIHSKCFLSHPSSGAQKRAKLNTGLATPTHEKNPQQMFLVTSFIGRTKTCQAQYWSC